MKNMSSIGRKRRLVSEAVRSANARRTIRVARPHPPHSPSKVRSRAPHRACRRSLTARPVCCGAAGAAAPGSCRRREWRASAPRGSASAAGRRAFHSIVRICIHDSLQASWNRSKPATSGAYAASGATLWVSYSIFSRVSESSAATQRNTKLHASTLTIDARIRLMLLGTTLPLRMRRPHLYPAQTRSWEKRKELGKTDLRTFLAISFVSKWLPEKFNTSFSRYSVNASISLATQST